MKGKPIRKRDRCLDCGKEFKPWAVKASHVFCNGKCNAAYFNKLDNGLICEIPIDDLSNKRIFESTSTEI